MGFVPTSETKTCYDRRVQKGFQLSKVLQDKRRSFRVPSSHVVAQLIVVVLCRHFDVDHLFDASRLLDDVVDRMPDCVNRATSRVSN